MGAEGYEEKMQKSERFLWESYEVPKGIALEYKTDVLHIFEVHTNINIQAFKEANFEPNFDRFPREFIHNGLLYWLLYMSDNMSWTICLEDLQTLDVPSCRYREEDEEWPIAMASIIWFK